MKTMLLAMGLLLMCTAASAQDDDGRAPAPGTEASDDPGVAPDDQLDVEEPAEAAEKPEPLPEQEERRVERDEEDEYDEPPPRRRKKQRRAARDSGFDELDWFDRHITWSLNDNLEPEIEENLALVWVLAVILTYPVGVFGMIWAPMAFSGAGNPGGDFWIDAIVHHLLFTIGRVCVLGCLPLNLIGLLYLEPVQMINLYDYHIKRAKAEGKLAATGRAPPPVRTVDAAFAY